MDAYGNVYIVGTTFSQVVPVSPNAMQPTNAGSTNASGGDVDTLLAVLTGSSIGNVTLIGGNDKASAGALISRLVLTNVDMGTAYHNMIDTIQWQTPGNYKLSISLIHPPRLSAPLLTQGKFQFRLTGSLERSFTIEAATNLPRSGPWILLTTNPINTVGTFDFTDPQAALMS